MLVYLKGLAWWETWMGWTYLSHVCHEKGIFWPQMANIVTHSTLLLLTCKQEVAYLHIQIVSNSSIPLQLFLAAWRISVQWSLAFKFGSVALTPEKDMWLILGTLSAIRSFISTVSPFVLAGQRTLTILWGCEELRVEEWSGEQVHMLAAKRKNNEIKMP